MMSILSSLNLLDNSIFLTLKKDNRKDRGYHENTFLTGEHLTALERGIGPLSVSQIADHYCDTNVDLYLEKGKNRLKYRKTKKIERPSSNLGDLIEEYILSLSQSFNTYEDSYLKIIDKDFAHFSQFEEKNREKLNKILNSETEESKEDKFRTKSVLNGINCCSRYESIFNTIHNYFQGDGKILPKPTISPNKLLGLSKDVVPDFLVKFGDTTIIGDIKTGSQFQDFHKLTCTGYALAYENQHNVDVNFGIIYFIPTVIKQSKSKNHFFFPQLYMFEIDSTLRRDFLAQRDQKYDLISNDCPPQFPLQVGHCEHSCKWQKNCNLIRPTTETLSHNEALQISQ